MAYSLVALSVLVGLFDLNQADHIKHEATVSIHDTVDFSPQDAERSLRSASYWLVNEEPANDCSCCTSLVKKGNIQTFQGDFFRLNSPDKWTNLVNLNAAGIYVVGRIDDISCGADGDERPIAGCGQTNGPLAVSADQSFETIGLLIAHEFGHVQGIGHDTSQNLRHRIMHETTYGRTVSAAQCGSFRKQLALNHFESFSLLPANCVQVEQEGPPVGSPEGTASTECSVNMTKNTDGLLWALLALSGIRRRLRTNRQPPQQS